MLDRIKAIIREAPRTEVSTLEPEVLIESPPVRFWDEPGVSSNSIENTVNPADQELSRYLSLPRSSMNLKDPIPYWNSEVNFPILKSLARKVLPAPASSVRSERVFSTSGNVLSEKRNSL